MDFWEQQAADAKRARAEKVSLNRNKGRNLIGIHGWLAFFVILQCLGLLATVLWFFTDSSISLDDVLTLNEYQYGLGDTFQTLIAFESFAVVTYIVLSITMLVLLFRKQKLAKVLAIVTLIYAAVYGMVDYAMTWSILESSGLSGGIEMQEVMKAASRDLRRGLFGVLVWVPYFLLSVRVKATLTRTRKDESEYSSDGMIANRTAKHLSSGKRGRWWINIGVVLFLIFVIVGFIVQTTNSQFPRLYEKVVREYHPETYREENTGNYNITYTGRWICGGNEDYLSCVNSHVTLYNSICAGKSLTLAAKSTCNDLSKFIDNIKMSYASCGYNCRTNADSDGRWGWQYLDLVAETHRLSNNDKVERVTRMAFCLVRIGPLSVGECEEN